MKNSTTINREEIKKFTEIADKWWDMNGSFKPLHQMNPLRLEYIKKLAPNLKGASVLDVGCGGGILCEPLCRLGANVTGIDAGQSNIEVAKLHAENSGLEINYIHTALEDCTFKEKFDIITCLEIVEHVENPALFVKLASQNLKDNGIIIFSTINRNVKSYLGAIIGAEYIMRILPVGTHNWNKFLKPSEMAGFIRNSGMEVIDITGMNYNPFSGKFTLKKDTDINYFISAQKIL